MEHPTWAPAGIDTERPSAARMYDYHLGSSHNFAVNREPAEKRLAVLLFDGRARVEPDVVPGPGWRTEPDGPDQSPPIRASVIAGVGRRE